MLRTALVTSRNALRPTGRSRPVRIVARPSPALRTPYGAFLALTRTFASGSSQQQNGPKSNSEEKRKQSQTDSQSRFWRWYANWTRERPPLQRFSAAWWAEQALICTVFAITGSSAMFFVRPLVTDVLGMKGTWRDGPWSFRVANLVLVTPCYTALLLTFGTLFGRQVFFKRVVGRMWGRVGLLKHWAPPKKPKSNSGT